MTAAPAAQPRDRSATARRLNGLLFSIAIVATAALVIYPLFPPAGYQWDFRVYRQAARVFLDGGNPYRQTYEIQAGFVYFPVTLWLFAPFARLSEPTASIVWLLLKLVVLVGLVAIWHQFVTFRRAWQHVVLLMLAFNAAIVADLATGNVAILEGFLIWMGLFALKTYRTPAAAAWIVAASIFKLAPGVFLLLLPWVDRRRGLYWMTAGFALLLGLIGASAAFCPALMLDFFQASAAMDERGWRNPSILALLRDAGGGLDGVRGWAWYGLSALGLVTYAFVHGRRDTDRCRRIFLGLVVLTLVLPRLKVYTYLVLIPVAVFVLGQAPRRWRWTIAALVVIPLPGSFLLDVVEPRGNGLLTSMFTFVPSIIWNYTCWYTVLLTLVLLTSKARAPRSAVARIQGSSDNVGSG